MRLERKLDQLLEKQEELQQEIKDHYAIALVSQAGGRDAAIARRALADLF